MGCWEFKRSSHSIILLKKKARLSMLTRQRALLAELFMEPLYVIYYVIQIYFGFLPTAAQVCLLVSGNCGGGSLLFFGNF